MEKILEKIPSQFPLVERPYAQMAEEMGLSEEELIAGLRDLKVSGVIRRIAGVLSHRKAAYAYNAMVVWKVPDKDVETTGALMAAFDEVSHCYERDGGGYWDYNVYTMIHGKTYEDCMSVVERIASSTGISDYRVHFSKREFKKTSFSVNYE